VSPFNFNAANGNLLVELIGTGQANVCNGCDNSYMEIDTSGTVTSRVSEYSTSVVPEPVTLLVVGSGVLGKRRRAAPQDQAVHFDPCN
jgi:hypothetical protein